MIIAGWSAYPRHIDFQAFREIADEVGAYLWTDIWLILQVSLQQDCIKPSSIF